MFDLSAYVPFLGLLIFGNIENLILASQGVVAKADMKKLSLTSIVAVIIWLLIGTLATAAAIKYADAINFIGGLAIFILGLQSMLQATHLIGSNDGN